jgi:NADH-quinone oxidoreductase subunit L
MEIHRLPVELVLFILGLPFAGFLFHALLGGMLVRMLGARAGRWLVGAIGTGVVLGAFALSWQLLQAMLRVPNEARRATYTLADWLAVGELQVPFEFLIDPLSVLMCLVVTGIGGLIHLYATGYMAEDEDYPRFFTYFNLFIFFMLTLVLAGNLLVMFIGWEGVGLCSYLLIGYFYRNAEWKYNTDSANKAFVVNRIGDMGFLLAMFIVWWRSARSPLSRLMRGRRRCWGWAAGWRRWWRCCSFWRRRANRRSCRSISGCPTRWQVPPPFRHSSMPPRWSRRASIC